MPGIRSELGHRVRRGKAAQPVGVELTLGGRPRPPVQAGDPIRRNSRRRGHLEQLARRRQGGGRLTGQVDADAGLLGEAGDQREALAPAPTRTDDRGHRRFVRRGEQHRPEPRVRVRRPRPALDRPCRAGRRPCRCARRRACGRPGHVLVRFRRRSAAETPDGTCRSNSSERPPGGPRRRPGARSRRPGRRRAAAPRRRPNRRDRRSPGGPVEPGRAARARRVGDGWGTEEELSCAELCSSALTVHMEERISPVAAPLRRQLHPSCEGATGDERCAS